MSSWAPFALTSLTAALLALPVTPALYELWKRADATPLPTSRHDGRIANFAEAFRSKLRPLLPQLEMCRNPHSISRTSIEGMEVLLVGRDDFDFDPRLTDGVAAVMLSEAALIPPGYVVEADVYTSIGLDLGERAALRAALCEGDIILGENSAVLRWLHADGSIFLRRGSTAYGRLSAGRSLRLEPGCGFERMSAPQIITVDPDQGNTIPLGHSACESEPNIDVRDMFTSSRPRLRIQGDFVLPAGETLNANVIATGELHIGPGARLFGSTKSYKDTVIGQDACVHGSIVSGGTMHLAPRCFVVGPLMAEGDVLIARGSRVGGPDALTTISSSGVQIAAGCQLHGTVWARVRGSVEG
jgi:predicted acyltransferase (DUF342 family)